MRPAMLHLGVLYMVGNILMASNLQFFVVERYCAYKYMRTYESWGSRLAWTLFTLTTTIATLTCYLVMIYGYRLVAINMENGPLSIFEYMLESMPVLPIITLPPCAFGAVFLAVKVRALHKQNQAIHSNRFDFSLSTKATVSETYQFLPGLLFLGYLHSSIAMSYYVLCGYRVYRIRAYGEADVLQFLIQQFQYIVVEAYGFFFMIYSFRTMPALRRALYEDFYWLFGREEDVGKTLGPGRVVNDEDGDERFKHLVNMWDQNFVQSNK
uniref:G_PROTEIN_RECEP_F1_2 domain-containing protein n=2 Tax=Bursaphelenchus xylophilus TaxID=6326 RepID=A0A1I7RJU8_BURXY